MCHPLADTGCDGFFDIRADCVQHSNRQYGDGSQLDYGQGLRADSCPDEVVQPAMDLTPLQNVVEDNFQWPGLQQVGGALSDNRYDTDGQRFPVRPQEIADSQRCDLP